MTPEQRDLMLGLVIGPDGSSQVAPEHVLRAFAVDDGVELSRRLVAEAATSCSAVGMELAIIAASVFGVADDVVDDLIELLYAEWHHSHESMVLLVGQAGEVRAVRALQRMATWVPDYLDFDESRALARKAIHALGRIPSAEATKVLTELSEGEAPMLAEAAQRQLKHRRS